MTIVHSTRLLLLLGTLAFAGGCGAGDVNDQTPVPPRSQADIDAERAAREKAMNPNQPAASSPAPATK